MLIAVAEIVHNNATIQRLEEETKKKKKHKL